MALGKSSLTRVAHSTTIPAPEKEVEKIIAKEETAATAATAKPVGEKKPVAEKKPATVKKPMGAAYAVGDELPVWLL